MYRTFANSKFPGRIAHGSSIFDDIQGKTYRPVLWQTFESAPSPLAGFLDTILCGLMGENAGGRVRFGIDSVPAPGEDGSIHTAAAGKLQPCRFHPVQNQRHAESPHRWITSSGSRGVLGCIIVLFLLCHFTIGL